MGNLKDKYTSEEWQAITSEIDKDRANGKPKQRSILLNVSGKSLQELNALRIILLDYFIEFELRILDGWIAWKNKELIEEVSESMESKVDQAIVEGLKRKGYAFESRAELKSFILTHCRMEVYKNNKRTFFVKEEPYLRWVSNPDISVGYCFKTREVNFENEERFEFL